MRIELDKPLSKTKLGQALKMTGNKKRVKVVCGTEIYDIGVITSKGDTIYFHTDNKQTSEFYRTRVISESSSERDINKKIDDILKKYDDDDTNYVTYIPSKKSKFQKEIEKNGYIAGDTPPFDSGVT